MPKTETVKEAKQHHVYVSKETTVIARENRVIAHAQLIQRRRVFGLLTRIHRCEVMAGPNYGELLAEVEALEAKAAAKKPAAKKPAVKKTTPKGVAV